MNPFDIMMYLGLAILVACVLIFRLKKRHGFLDYFVLGWGLQVLLSLPAGIWQAVTGWGFLTMGSWTSYFLLPMAGWIFNMTGMSVRILLGLSEQKLFDSAGVMGLYLLLAFIQGTVFASLFAWRYMKCGTFKDWIIVGLGVIFLVNSLMNVGFCWDVG